MKNIQIKTQKGITLVALVVTIVVLLIIASITIYNGSDVIKKANLEGMKTNMLLIQAKAKEYVEEATFKMGINPTDEQKNNARNEVYIQNAGLKKASEESGLNIPSSIPQSENLYYVTKDALTKMGLDNIETGGSAGEYLIEFDETNIKANIYNTEGYDGKYSLEEIDKLEE